MEYYINKYDLWSSYKPEDDGVFIAYASIHGNTEEAAKEFAKKLESKGIKKVVISDLSRVDMAEAIEDAFRYDKIVLASSTYDAGIFTPMEIFLNELQAKNYQNRKIGLIENGTWAPLSAKCMKEKLEKMKDITICQNIVTVRTKLTEVSKEEMNKLIDELI